MNQIKDIRTIDGLTNGSFSEPRKVTWKKEDGTISSSPLVRGDGCGIPEDAKPTILGGHHYPSYIGTDFLSPLSRRYKIDGRDRI